MPKTSTTTTSSACPTCSAYTIAMPSGHGDYCPACSTVVTRVRGVAIVRPNAFRPEMALR